MLIMPLIHRLSLQVYPDPIHTKTHHFEVAADTLMSIPSPVLDFFSDDWMALCSSCMSTAITKFNKMKLEQQRNSVKMR
jgi:hypothetical protein